MSEMFKGCYRFKRTKFDVSKWSVSKVTNMSQMFYCLYVEKLDLSKWELNSAIKNAKYETSATKNMLRSNHGLKCLKTPFGLTIKVNQNGKWDVDVVKKGEQVCRYKTD